MYNVAIRQPEVTPKIAPPAARAVSFFCFMMNQASPRPTASLQSASRTWLTEVGRMSPCPWKNPRNAEVKHMSRAEGPNAAMAAQELGEFIQLARGRLKPVINTVPATPRIRKIHSAV